MPVPVAVFNASSQTIAVTVNNGPQTTVPGTGPGQNWQPQTQASGTGPTYTPGHPAPNVVGNLGTNQIQAFVKDVPIGGGPFFFSLPADRPVGSVQMYLFFATVHRANWMILTDGQVVAQQLISSPLPEKELKF